MGNWDNCDLNVLCEATVEDCCLCKKHKSFHLMGDTSKRINSLNLLKIFLKLNNEIIEKDDVLKLSIEKYEKWRNECKIHIDKLTDKGKEISELQKEYEENKKLTQKLVKVEIEELLRKENVSLKSDSLLSSLAIENTNLRAEVEKLTQIITDIRKANKSVSQMFKLTLPQMKQLRKFLSSTVIDEEYNLIGILEDELVYWLDNLEGT